MRLTKSHFLRLVDRLSKVVGEKLYLVSGINSLYLSPVNDSFKCQDSAYLCLNGSFSQENFKIIEAFEEGYKTALNRK